MRFLTPEQAAARLDHDKNVAKVAYLDRDRNHNGLNGHSKIPLEIKAMVYAGKEAGMKITDMANLFGIGVTTAGAIGRGEKKGYNLDIPDQELREKVINPVHENIVTKATDLVMAAMEKAQNKIGDDKNKLRDLSGAARDFASIIDHVSPKSESGNVAAVVLIGTNPYPDDRYKVIEAIAKVG
jgi:hypothetical protein